jgi:long-chain acyl-CoA synthetase
LKYKKDISFNMEGFGDVCLMSAIRNCCCGSAGEYIAVEKVEAVYKKNPLVEQIWVYGNSFESTLVAVVVPNEDALKSWAADNGVGSDFDAILADPKTNDYVWSELNKTAKEGKLKV